MLRLYRHCLPRKFKALKKDYGMVLKLKEDLLSMLLIKLLKKKVIYLNYKVKHLYNINRS